MKINHVFTFTAYIYLILLLSHVTALPFSFGNGQNGYRRLYQQPTDNWNIMSAPRSITPHLIPKHNDTNIYHPPRKTSEEIDDDVLDRLRNLKVCQFFDRFFFLC